MNADPRLLHINLTPSGRFDAVLADRDGARRVVRVGLAELNDYAAFTRAAARVLAAPFRCARVETAPSAFAARSVWRDETDAALERGSRVEGRVRRRSSPAPRPCALSLA